MKIINAICDLIEKICKYFLTVAFAVMVIITLIEVVRRYAMGLSYPWAEELVRFLLVWTTFIGGSVALKRGELVYLDLIQKKLSEKKLKLNLAINSVIVLAFLVIIFKLSLEYSLSNVILMQKSAGLRIPMVIPYMSIPLGFLFMIIFTLNNFLIGLNKEKIS